MAEAIASCLALVDWQGDLEPARWLEIALQFFRDQGFDPDFCSYVIGPKSKKGLKGLLKNIGEGHRPETISLIATVPPHNDLRNWFATAGFRQGDRKQKESSFCCVTRGSNSDINYFVEVTKRLASQVSLQYGFAYQRAMSRGPDFYAFGVIGHGPGDEPPADEKEQIARWLRERLDISNERSLRDHGHVPFRHLEGMQRDVYPLNILTSKHLASQIDGAPLERWISLDRRRGHLQFISDGVWGWIVPDSALNSVRCALGMAGLLIARPPSHLIPAHLLS